MNEEELKKNQTKSTFFNNTQKEKANAKIIVWNTQNLSIELETVIYKHGAITDFQNRESEQNLRSFGNF